MRKQVDTNKQIIKSLRLSQKQWQTIQTQMQEKNLNFSQLVLNSLLHQNSQTPTKSKKQKAIANKELVIGLAKWGNNLNQIAKCLNTNKYQVPTITIFLGSHLVFEKQKKEKIHEYFLESIKKPIDTKALSDEILQTLNLKESVTEIIL
ncbi:hypothetical protein ID0475_13810 [Helicobacter pylori]